VVDEAGDLGDRKDEDEVEEELERRHALLSLQRSLEQLVPDGFVEHQLKVVSRRRHETWGQKAWPSSPAGTNYPSGQS
jgi:hypothetical protein